MREAAAATAGVGLYVVRTILGEAGADGWGGGPDGRGNRRSGRRQGELAAAAASETLASRSRTRTGVGLGGVRGRVRRVGKPY
jgi:hypothetical protein